MPNHLSLIFTADYYSLSKTLQKEVYKEYYSLVYPIIYFILQEYQATEDMIQESFLRSIDKAAQLHDHTRMEAWLKMVARTVSLNFLRKLKRNRNELDSDDVFTSREPPESLIYPSLEDEVEANLLKEDIRRYMGVLKPEYRQLIEMRWYSNLSYKEIAMILGTTESIVRQKLYRAREAVKQRLQDDWGNHHE
ncbi:MAG: sigma-70 family polymerase sigma factor [Paenibacillaceae bacterium]|jgi:RNA polymerase sigma-70 factor (ECF subfamily)|nr:sigma-70 family polymerase sigma factor [Paenibacillaceae bacterium]